MQFINDEINQATIKVIGVGGCGGNIVGQLQNKGVFGVSCVAINTDTQALASLGDKVECVQIGREVTYGLGAGANPDIAAQSAEAESERIKEIARGCNMVFIVAGMGKGTGTGAAPVVARICREAGALTVAVVTRPFVHEMRDEKADAGISKLSEHVDSLVIVPNAKLQEVLGDNVKYREALMAANDVLFNAVCGISEIITRPGEVNLDFNDVRTVMSEKGKAIIGSARQSGEDRASQAAYDALRCPLMEDVDLSSARAILVNITCCSDNMRLSEITEVQEVIKEMIPDSSAQQFSGTVFDNEMKEDMRVTIIVTGISEVDALGDIGINKPPSLEAIRGAATDHSFISGRDKKRLRDLQDDNAKETKTPAILRRQVS